MHGLGELTMEEIKMTDGWSSMKEAREKSGGKFVRLKDGESIVGVFRGTPYTFYKKWGEEEEYSEWQKGRAFRFRINFITKENSQYVARIFEGNSYTGDQLWACYEEYGLDAVYKVVRKGSGTDTRYTLLFQSKLNEVSLDVIKKVPLEVIRHGGKVVVGGKEVTPTGASGYFDDEPKGPGQGAPFDEPIYDDKEAPPEDDQEPLPF